MKTKRLRVLVCGDRNWTDKEFIWSRLDKLADLSNPLIIHGAARGADNLAGEWADDRMVPVESYPANWKRFGRAAGPMRNQRMIDAGKPDLVMAFHDNLEQSKGTKDMVTRARKHNIRVKTYQHRQDR